MINSKLFAKVRYKASVPHSLLLTNTVLEVLASAIRQEKYIKAYRLGRKI